MMPLKGWLLFLLLPVESLFSQDLLQLRLVGQPEKSATEFVGSNIVDVNGNICAAIQVLSDLDGLSYDVYNQLKRVDHQPGRDMVYVQAEEQVLEILHSGYQPLKLVLLENGIRLASSEVWIIKITGEKMIEKLSIGILCEPSFVDIWIDGINRGHEESQMVTVGRHELRLMKPGYHSLTDSIFVSAENTLFRRKLVKMPDVLVNIESDPSDAEVFIDSLHVGRTPLSMMLSPVRHNLLIKKQFFLDHKQLIDVNPPKTVIEIPLQSNYGRLRVSSAPKSGLYIYLNDVLQHQKTPYFFERLDPAIYRIKARSQDYETDEQTVSIEKGVLKVVNLNSSALFNNTTDGKSRTAKRNNWFWIGGGVLLVGGITAAILSDQEKMERGLLHVVIPKNPFE